MAVVQWKTMFYSSSFDLIETNCIVLYGIHIHTYTGWGGNLRLLPASVEDNIVEFLPQKNSILTALNAIMVFFIVNTYWAGKKNAKSNNKYCSNPKWILITCWFGSFKWGFDVLICSVWFSILFSIGYDHKWELACHKLISCLYRIKPLFVR